MPEPDIKICGLCSAADARSAEELGASYLGMILSQGFGRSLLPDQAMEMAMVVDAPIVAVLVDESVDEAVRIAELVGVSAIQLHGAESPAYVRELRERGDWAIWKTVRVREPNDPARAAIRYGTSVDGLLLDGWHPERPGGTGTAFDWEGLASIRQALPPPVRLIAAGGLTPANVQRAVRTLCPDVVDVSSGVESSPRHKDRDLMAAFVRNARNLSSRTLDAHDNAG